MRLNNVKRTATTPIGSLRRDAACAVPSRCAAAALLVLALAAVAATQPASLVSVGDINFYGLHKVTPERILEATKLKTGGPLPPSGGLEDEIENIPGVVLASVEAVCCEGPRAAIFIGIEEKGAPHAAFRSEPAGNATLPDPLLDTYHEFLISVERAVTHGDAAEDLTAGHSLMADPQARTFQNQFATFAASHVELLRSVLRTASDAEQRAVAATVIGYAPNKKQVADDLQYAMQDPDPSVRANAIRSLTAIAVLSVKMPDLGIRISPTWFIELLNSVVLSDRFESSKALLTLTDRPNPEAVQQIRERALPALAEMARWKTPRYALPPFLLLGRVAGLPDADVQQAFEKGDREAVIKKALAK